MIHRRREGERQLLYGCSACQRKGRTVCGNAPVIPIEHMEEAVIGSLEVANLHPEAVQRAVAAADPHSSMRMRTDNGIGWSID